MHIINNYYSRDSYNVGCDHDVIYMYTTDAPIIPKDIKKLHDLGWFQENVPEGEYSPEESWKLYI